MGQATSDFPGARVHSMQENISPSGISGLYPSKREKMSGPENPRGKVAGSPQEVGSWIARAGCTHAYAANGVPLSI